ncbi:cell division protein [Candidatus Methylacidiphilum fumarolicum]|uniref:Cell division septal protein FtsQ n=4 Tax=Candidatus Methylacidiphilum fumarolicum TaxID=591154 RepID=I0JW44_METFB|nr:FtsQ-type POTRA domain-containing protein [Candidatus Methylacidiphilum fumarolicum]MBW6415712.1 FtsQ-type POTRA domain-containing protein [Candidatus Methylacidiphilum fumarolicum]TFE68763.1 cell division protein [Candidatus Methylacidiphilum fumarolicum]TFE71924.1 cell division protein [Candidatus Methylacidiphilum fumarolicum]TFE72472.1 cell division protein [Candidatus Methylacidiphilum fumarolicum]TFE76635.1 cell division protein [Candidatus Methylacidiphilum fumarolicum]
MRVTNRPKKRKKNRLKKVPMEFLHVEGKESVPKKRIKFSLLLRALLYIGLFVIGTVGGFKSWDYFKNNLLACYGYQLRRIDVELIGSGRISKDEVIRASNVHVGDNIFNLSLKDIYSKVCSIQEVDKALVRRDLPDRVLIRIWERKPVVRLAVKSKENRKYCLDEKGYPFVTENREDLLSLPEMVGVPLKLIEGKKRIEEPEVSAALNLLRILENSSLHFAFDPQTIDVSRPLSIGLLTRDGVRLTFRIDHLNEQVQRLQKIYSFSQSHGRKISMVDLTPEQNIPVIFQ